MLDMAAGARQELGDGVQKLNPDAKNFWLGRKTYQIKGNSIRPPGRINGRE